MSRNQYGTVREYRDSPDLEYRDQPSSREFDPTASFVSAVDDISGKIFQISTNVSTIERQLNDVGSKRDSKSLRDKIHEQEQRTNKLIASTTQMFKKLARQRSPHRQATVKIEKLRSDFEETIQRYNRLQKIQTLFPRTRRLVASKVKAAPPIQTQTSSTLIDLSDDVSDRANLLEDQRRVQLQAQAEAIETDVQMIEEREEQIRQLEGDIININDIFRDLAALVYEQGDMVDSIEANVERGHDNVVSGNQQLEQASKYANKYRKKLCIFAVVMAVIAVIVTIILVVELKGH